MLIDTQVAAIPWSIEQWIAILALIATGIGSVGTAIAAIYTARQAKTSAEANKTSSWGVLISLEAAITSTRSEWESAISESSRIYIETGRNPERIEYQEALMDTATRRSNACRELYFNSLDRLCASIRLGLIPEGSYRQDYRKLLEKHIETNTGLFEESTTGHPHMLHVHRCWKAERSAVDRRDELLNL